MAMETEEAGTAHIKFVGVGDVPPVQGMGSRKGRSLPMIVSALQAVMLQILVICINESPYLQEVWQEEIGEMWERRP